MSTKQTVIFSFMIVFLGVMFYAMGSWFYWSIELAGKKQMLEVLDAKNGDLKIVLNGITNHPGVEGIVIDPEKGLQRQFEAIRRIAEEKKGTAEGGGAEQRRDLYEKKEAELEAKLGKCTTAKDWTPGSAAAKWKEFYAQWSDDNKKITAALGRLNKDKKEKDEKIATAEVDLENELKNEETTKVKSVADRKEMDKELSDLREQHEVVTDRLEAVTRETRAVSKVVKQGELVYVARDLKLVTINLGSVAGLRKGLRFDVYSKSHVIPFNKGAIEIVEVRPSSADGLILPPKRETLWDPITGWVAPDPRMRYSIFAAAGQDESEAQALEKPKSRADKIEDYRRIKEFGEEKAEEMRAEKAAPTAPPFQVGAAFAPIVMGDWIHSPDFEPLMPETVYRKRAVNELLAMENVNVAPAAFYFTEDVKAYRQEFLKRLCERNQCKVAETMSADVNYVVTAPSSTNLEVLRREVDSNAAKGEDVSIEVKKLRKTLLALEEAKKTGAEVLAENDVENFFAQRHRKLELLRGTAIQPGQHVFFISGETQLRSAADLKKYITEHGGVVANELNDTVEYVVAGTGLDKKFFEETVKAKGLKVIREDELPRFFGLE